MPVSGQKRRVYPPRGFGRRVKPNPVALMLAAAMMLEHVKQLDLARRLRTAIDQILNLDRVRTGDLGGSASTTAFTRALVSRIANS
ncbi:MAG: hypothetical protein FJY25_00100 [Betaproteobacteria bacterium]|nr:hypothetical protein [Betaproteobacteria bacterium]